MAFRSHGVSCCHPLSIPFPLDPLFPYHYQHPPSLCPLPGAQAECSVRRVSTERPLCVLTKAECPGDKRGRSGLRAVQSQGEEKAGGRRVREGQSAGGYMDPLSPENSYAP